MNTVRSFEAAVSELGNRNSRKMGNNTYLERLGPEEMGIRLHHTHVVKFRPDETVLDSGGWRTLTTRDRINAFCPGGWRIQQEGGVWYVEHGQWRWYFQDGGVIKGEHYTGNQVTDKEERAAVTLKRKIAAYCKGYIEELVSGRMEKPGPGDCFYCQLRTEDGRSLGAAMKDKSHILSHIVERYYVPSMLYNAAQRFGGSPALKSAIAAAWEGNVRADVFTFGNSDFLVRDAYRILYRYVKEQCGMAA